MRSLLRCSRYSTISWILNDGFAMLCLLLLVIVLFFVIAGYHPQDPGRVLAWWRCCQVFVMRSEVANSKELGNDGIAGERLLMRDLDRFGSFANIFLKTLPTPSPNSHIIDHY